MASADARRWYTRSYWRFLVANARHLQQVPMAGFEAAPHAPILNDTSTPYPDLVGVYPGPQAEEDLDDAESQAAFFSADFSYLFNPDPTPDEIAAAGIAGAFHFGPDVPTQSGSLDDDVLLVHDQDPEPSMSSPDSYVRVEHGKFMLGCKEFLFNGGNSPFLMDDATNGRRWAVIATLNQLKNAGVSVVRTWGFGVLGAPLQYSPGSYNEAKLEGMDFVLSEIKKRGMKAVIPFVDFWTQWDSMPKYVSWSNTAKTLNDFFTDDTVRKIYRDHVTFFLNRRNKFTGVLYKKDTTIVAWNLANEPRCEGCGIETMTNWIREMSAFIKSQGARQLVTTGLEGFFATNDYNPASWGSNMGQDFFASHNISSIDYAVYHVWPDNWAKTDSFQKKVAFLKRWIDSHKKVAQALGKPLVLEEFGKDLSQGGIQGRNRFYDVCYKLSSESIMANGMQRGVMFWALGEGYSWELPTYAVYWTSSTYSIISRFHKDMEDFRQGQIMNEVNNCYAVNQGSIVQNP
eukprot:jgi/Mesvir1/7842/Mv24168-RA.1